MVDTGRDSKLSVDYMVDDGGGWRTGCRSHPNECIAGGRTGSACLECCATCDRKMNMKTNENVYRTVGRPTIMYGAETMSLQR